MSVKVIEYKLVGKKNDSSLCEDFIYNNNGIIAIIDGATSKTGTSFNGKLGGRLAGEIIIDALDRVDRAIAPIAKLSYISNAIKELKEENRIDFPIIANIVIYDSYNSSIISYGDCKLLINGKELINRKDSDTKLALIRSDYNKKLLASGYTLDSLINNDLGRKEILSLLLEQEKKSNIDFPCINGTKINESMVEYFSVGKGDLVVLASDGYPRVFNTLSESEKYLSRVLTNDPLCIDMYISTKGVAKGSLSYDDRAYISFIIE